MTEEFGYWFSGFVDGEGCFYMTVYARDKWPTCRFTINMRADDRSILEECQRQLGLGQIHDRKATGKANPQACLRVQRKMEVYQLLGVFDRYPLRSRKKFDYQIWKEGVLAWMNLGRGSKDWSSMQDARVRLVANRVYADTKR